MHDLTIHPNEAQRAVLTRLGFDRLPVMRGAEDPPANPPADPPANPPADPPANPPADEKVELSKADHDNLQRQLRESREKLDKIERDQAAAARKKQEDEGNFKELSETEKARADKLEAELQSERENARVERIAKRLNFRDPEDVIGRIPEDARGDDSKTEKALKDLAKAKKYLLIDGEKERQGDQRGDGGGDGGSGGSGGSGDGGSDGGDGKAGVFGTSRLARAYAGSGESK